MNDASRSDLHTALAEAVVVEQQLGLQYLYAAASLQWVPPADLPSDDPRQIAFEQARGAAKTLLLLARQEMEHQSWVLNLLIATGAPPPSFDAPAMPMSLPVGGPAYLAPFSRETLLRFIAEERPDHLDDPAGPCAAPPDLRQALDDLEREMPGLGTPDASAIYDHYVEIYRSLVEVELSNGPVVLPPERQRGVQVVPDPVYGVSGGRVESFADALSAVDQVVLEGEGASSATLWWGLADEARRGAVAHGIPEDGPAEPSTTTPDRSHFCRLVDLWPSIASDPTALPVLPVPTNPALPSRGDPTGDGSGLGLITHPFSVRIGEVAEKAYGILLDALRITYAASALGPMDSTAIHWTAYFQSMTMVVRPLLMVMARLPRHSDGGDERAGMTFHPIERFGGVFDSTCTEARSDVVSRLQRLSAELEDIVGDGSVIPADTVDRGVVVTLLVGLRQDLLRIAENLEVDSSTPLGG